MSQRRSLNVQALALLIGTGVAQVLVAGLYILTARRTGLEEYGSIVSAIGLGMAGAGFLDLGSIAYSMRELASQRITQDELNARARTRFAVTAAASSVVLIVAYLTKPVFIATAALLTTTIAVQTILLPLRAFQRAEAVGWLIAFGRLAAIGIFVLQGVLGVAPGLALWSSLALGDVILVVCAYLVTPKADRLQLGIGRMRNPWSGARWYALSTVSGSVAQLDLPILAALAGASAAGIYGGVNRWTQPMLVIIGAFSQAAAPFIAATPRVAALKGPLLRASWILAVAVVLSLTLVITAPWLVTSVLGAEFSGSAPVLRLLAIAMLLNAVTQPLTIALQSRRFDHVAAVLVALTAVTQLAVTAAFASNLGALSAGLGLLIGQIVALLATVGFVAVIAWQRRARHT